MKTFAFGFLSLLTMKFGLQQPLSAVKSDVRNVHQKKIKKPLPKRLGSLTNSNAKSHLFGTLPEL